MSDLNSGTPEQKCLIEAVNVDKSYSTPREVIHVLTQTNLQVLSGEVLGIIGASGVGKSTLLHVLGGLDKPMTGSVLFQGKDIYKQSNGYLENFRNGHIGFVFQFFNLLPDFTALENAMLPALIRNQDRCSAKERAEYLLCEVGMKDRMHHKPGELSGGESQRVCLARGLVNQPDLLLADEPTGSLDRKTANEIFSLFLKLKSKNRAILYATHNRELSNKADYKLNILDGKIRRINE